MEKIDRRITMSDIAQMVGVSIGTVDRALNNRGRINTETREKIMRTAKKHNYKANKIASALGKRRIIRIAAVFPTEPNYFFGEIGRGFEIAQQEFDDYKLEITHIPTLSLDAKTQIKKLKAIKPGDFDGVLLATGGKGLEQIIDVMLEDGIPVATFNSDAVHSNRLFYSGVDFTNSGRIAANLLGLFCQGRGKAAIFSGFEEVSSHHERKDGFLEVLSNNYPDIKYVFGGDYADHEELAYQTVRKFLETHTDITAVYTTSAPGVVGAGRAVKELDSTIRPVLIGYDLNKYSAEFLRSGICWALIDQSPILQSFNATKTMLHYIINGSLGEIVSINSSILLKESLEDYPEYRQLGRENESNRFEV